MNPTQRGPLAPMLFGAIISGLACRDGFRDLALPLPLGCPERAHQTPMLLRSCLWRARLGKPLTWPPDGVRDQLQTGQLLGLSATKGIQWRLTLAL